MIAIAVAGALLGLGLRVWILRSHLGAVDSDEAVVGLLAKGILHGRLPVFFPGQGYGGTQEEFIAAPLIALFGLSATTIRAAPIALWAASAVLVWRIGLHSRPAARGDRRGALLALADVLRLEVDPGARLLRLRALPRARCSLLVLRLREPRPLAISSCSGSDSAAASGRARRSRSSRFRRSAGSSGGHPSARTRLVDRPRRRGRRRASLVDRERPSRLVFAPSRRATKARG